jgi:uncharacterized Rossmann fold enzyme
MEGNTMMFDFRKELSKITPKIADGARIYIFGAGANWEGICKVYKYLVNINIDDCIDGFIDNDKRKQGTLFHGKPVCGLPDIDLSNAVILISIASWDANKEILAQLLPYRIYRHHSVFGIDWVLDVLMRYEYEVLSRLKDKHKGERCFVVGNGPSLTTGDLDKLKKENTFAANRIFRIFDRTEWRPTYYVCEEDEIFKNSQDEIAANIRCPAFYSRDSILGLDKFHLKDFFFFFLDHRATWKPSLTAEFSEEPFIIQCGQTVTYACLQLAAYMGFGEIYLLGCDNTFNRGVKANGEMIFGNGDRYHFDDGYISTNIYSTQIDVINAAYRAAREYCEARNIKIRNATRGGTLEVFERVDFDSFFPG